MRIANTGRSKGGGQRANSKYMRVNNRAEEVGRCCFVTSPKRWEKVGIFTESAPRPIQSESQHVCMSVRPSVCCPLPVKFIFRPLIGPQVT